MPTRRDVLTMMTTATVLSASTAGCISRVESDSQDSPSLDGDWPSVGGDAGNRGYFAESIPESLVEDWATTRNHEPMFVGPPVVANDSVYIGITDGVVAIGPQEGIAEWQNRFDSATAAAPAVANGSVFVPQDGYGTWYTPGGNRDHSRLVSVDAGTGEQQWSTSVDAARMYSVSVSDARLFFRTARHPYAVSSTTGAIEWVGPELEPLSTRRIRYAETAAPAIAEDLVIYPTHDGAVALDSQDGTVAWDVSSGAVFSAPTVHDGTVYLPTESELVAVDVDTGERTWSSEGTYLNSPAVDDEYVYTSDHQGVIVHDKTSGEKSWEIPDLGESWTSPICTENSLLVGGIRSALRVIDIDTQTVQWSLGQRTVWDVAVGAGGIYVVTGSSESGRPMLLSLSDGSAETRQR